MTRPRLLLLALTAVGAVAVAAARRAAAEPDERARAAATRTFDRAQKAYDKHDYEAALEGFREVARVLDSPNALFMAARCLEQLGRRPEAFETMSDAVDRATQRANDDPSYLRTRDAAAAEREALATTIGRVVVAAADPPPGLEVTVAGRTIEPGRYGRQLGVEPGPVVVDARAPDRSPFRKRFALGAGQLVTIAVVLEGAGDRVEEPPGPGPDGTLRTAGFVTLGLGVVGLGGFAVTGALANLRYAQLEQECGTAPCVDPSYQQVIDEGRTFDLVANVSVAVGAAALIAGTTMVIVGWPSADPATEVSLGLGPGFAGVRIVLP